MKVVITPVHKFQRQDLYISIESKFEYNLLLQTFMNAQYDGRPEKEVIELITNKLLELEL